jgi:hypothetical protein
MARIVMGELAVGVFVGIAELYPILELHSPGFNGTLCPSISVAA